LIKLYKNDLMVSKSILIEVCKICLKWRSKISLSLFRTRLVMGLS